MINVGKFIGILAVTIMFLGTPYASLAQQDKERFKYVWIDQVEHKTARWRDRDYALEQIEGNSADYTVTKACQSIHKGSVGVVMEVVDIKIQEYKISKEAKDYRVTAKLSGYCRLSPGSKEYIDILWCDENERGQKQCAVNFTF